MNSNRKYTVFLVLAFIGVWTCKQLQPGKKTEEIVIDNIHISKQPCISAVQELLRDGADSAGICDCILPEFYNLVKHDAVMVEKLRTYGTFYKLEGALNDSFVVQFAKCVRSNILDSNYTFNLKPEYELSFKKKLKEGFTRLKEFERTDAEALSNCIVENLNGKITIAEYFSEDYLQVGRINQILVDCVSEHRKAR